MTSRIPAIFDAQDPCSPLSIASFQTALLLLDYQKMSLAMLGDAAIELMSTARRLQQWAADNEILVVHCLIDAKSGKAPKPFMKSASRFKGFQERLEANPTLADEYEGLSMISANEKTDSRIPGYISAFEGPSLREILKAASIKSLILGGISTSGCLLSTCRAATDAEYIVTVIDDACADTVPGLHNMLMQHVIPSTAHVAKCDQLIDIWKTR